MAEPLDSIVSPDNPRPSFNPTAGLVQLPGQGGAPGPYTVDPGAAIRSYISAFTPELMGQVLGLEQQYGPQFQELDIAARNRNLDAFTALIGNLTNTAGDVARGETRVQSQAEIDRMRQFGGPTIAAYIAANPYLKSAMDRSDALGGVSTNAAYDALSRQLLGGAPTAINLTPERVMAGQLGVGGTLTPERVAAERIAAERIAAGQVQAGEVGAGALGQSLYQQALRNQQLSPLSQALQAQGLGMAQMPGQLNPEELRAATQGARERFASAGRLEDIAGVTGEALARAGASRERQMQDLAAAQAINAQLLGAQQAGQGLATDVLRADIARQQANVATGLQAGTFNVEAALRAAQANQQTGLQASQANQDAMLRAALANQQAGMQAQQFNITNLQGIQQANQAANLQAALANQAAGQRGFEFGATQSLQSQLANREFAAQQAQQRFGNLGAVLGSEQAMLGADRAYALQQAAQQAGVTAASLGLIGFGQTPAAMQFGAQQQGISAGQMQMGPQLFDPNAGINLALQNASNLGNYQASTYGARAGAQGQIAGAMLGAIGNLGGAAITKYCWVAREVYGEDNPKWLMFREWLLTKAPDWFRNLYIKHGERFAAFIRTKPSLKRLIRKWMDSRIQTLALA